MINRGFWDLLQLEQVETQDLNRLNHLQKSKNNTILVHFISTASKTKWLRHVLYDRKSCSNWSISPFLKSIEKLSMFDYTLITQRTTSSLVCHVNSETDTWSLNCSSETFARSGRCCSSGNVLPHWSVCSIHLLREPEHRNHRAGFCPDRHHFNLAATSTSVWGVTVCWCSCYRDRRMTAQLCWSFNTPCQSLYQMKKTARLTTRKRRFILSTSSCPLRSLWRTFTQRNSFHFCGSWNVFRSSPESQISTNAMFPSRWNKLSWSFTSLLNKHRRDDGKISADKGVLIKRASRWPSLSWDQTAEFCPVMLWCSCYGNMSMGEDGQGGGPWPPRTWFTKHWFMGSNCWVSLVSTSV